MGPRRRRATCAFLAAVIGLLAVAGSAYAQRFFREGSIPARYAPAVMPDASFTFCRLEYRSGRREPSGIGWQTDYPYAEINLMTRLSELTGIPGPTSAEDAPVRASCGRERRRGATCSDPLAR